MLNNRTSVLTISALILFARLSFGMDLGKPLNIAIDPNGNPRVGLSYSYDADWGWMISFKTTVSNGEVSALPPKVLWNLYNKKTSTWLSNWKETIRDSVFMGQFSISEKPLVRAILLEQKVIELVFAKTNGSSSENIYHLSIGTVCDSYPEKVVNLTEENQPACVVDPTHLPDPSKECQDFRKELLSYIEQQLLTCEIAKQAYNDKGCGVLDCKR